MSLTPEEEAEIHARVYRACDAAYDVIRGVCDDHGFEAAIDLFQAQINAAIVLRAEEISEPLDAAKYAVLAMVCEALGVDLR